MFCIESKFKKGFEKNDMHVVITIKSMTVMSPTIVFEPKLVPMFFHMDSIRKFINSFQSWSFSTKVIIIVSVKGRGNSKGEK